MRWQRLRRPLWLRLSILSQLHQGRGGQGEGLACPCFQFFPSCIAYISDAIMCAR
ncbi:MAG: hypothetical protein N3E41_08550 [Thermofilaceae archaeon]|nr:hypothetical protein [Thermofilaceae archaeon]